MPKAQRVRALKELHEIVLTKKLEKVLAGLEGFSVPG